MSYYFNRILKNRNFEEVINLVTEELKKEGFGVLANMDVSSTLKNKLDVNFKKYTILGACHPEYAYQALLKEDKIGVFLPCNVVVEEGPDGSVEVAIVDPLSSMISVENDALKDIALEIKQKLLTVANNLK